MITDYYVVTIVYTYLVPVIGLLFLLYLIRYNSLFNQKQQKLFILTAAVNLALILSTSLDLLFATGTYHVFVVLRRLTSFLNFAVGPIIPLLLYKIFRQEKTPIWIYLPSIINVIICFVSIFVKLVFFIVLENAYQRGVLFYLPMAVAAFHVLLIIFMPSKNLHKQGRKGEFIVLIAIILCMATAVILETFFYFVCINYGVSAICVIVYYSLNNIHYFKSDPLTSAYNRQMYNQELARVNKSCGCVIALMDINNFKYINDTYGHEMGDNVLKLFVNIVQKHTQNISMLYRIGGDEFVIISKKYSIKELQMAIDGAVDELRQHKLSFACGIRTYDSKVNIDEFVNEVDKDMYAQKNLMKNSCAIIGDELTEADASWHKATEQ